MKARRAPAWAAWGGVECGADVIPPIVQPFLGRFVSVFHWDHDRALSAAHWEIVQDRVVSAGAKKAPVDAVSLRNVDPGGHHRIGQR